MARPRLKSGGEYPQDGAGFAGTPGICRNTYIEAEFDQELRPETLANNIFLVRGHTESNFDCVGTTSTVVIGGVTTNYNTSNKVFYSSDGITWTEAGNLPIPLYAHSSLVYNNKIWVFGGQTNSSNPSEGNIPSRKVFYSSNGITWSEAGSNSLPLDFIQHPAARNTQQYANQN